MFAVLVVIAKEEEESEEWSSDDDEIPETLGEDDVSSDEISEEIVETKCKYNNHTLMTSHCHCLRYYSCRKFATIGHKCNFPQHIMSLILAMQ